jgi:hypothetical protein
MKARTLGLLFYVAIAGVAESAPISGQGTWETTLQGRDLDGNASTFEAYYDTVLGITWLADANFAQTSGHDSDGLMTWSATNAWLASLNSGSGLFGLTGWRLPSATDIGTPGCSGVAFSGTDCGYNVVLSGSEMAHMYYSTLDNIAYCTTSGSCPQSGWGLANTGPFANLQALAWFYWSGTTYAPNTAFAWNFNFTRGQQSFGQKEGLPSYAWIVHDGDVAPASPVPSPTAAWLLLPSLAGLALMRRRRGVGSLSI